MNKKEQKQWEDSLKEQLQQAVENNEVEIGEGLMSQIEADACEIEVVDEEVIKVNVEDDKIPAMKNIPYVKIENKDGDILNPIGGSYPNFFPNRRERRAITKNPKNNKKGIRLVVTKIGDASFVKTEVHTQHILANKIPIIDDHFKFVGWDYRKKRTLVHNQVKNN